ncbi:MAG: hypothetical protein ABWZ99_04415 [Ilumatobacteraceae bacterium]
MYSNYDFTRALVSDHQYGLHESARRHRLAAFGRARRSQPETSVAEILADVHYLPAQDRRSGDGRTRAAS